MQNIVLLFGLLCMQLSIVYLFAQPAALIYWDGGWRKAAIAPLFLTVPAILYGVMGAIYGSNLWPMPVMFVFGLATFYLCVVGLVRRFRG
jgi:hypothetical protein